MMKAAIFLALALAVLPYTSAQQSDQSASISLPPPNSIFLFPASKLTAICSFLFFAAYASISPAQYQVELAYQINGTDVVTPPCTNSAPGAECLPQVST